MLFHLLALASAYEIMAVAPDLPNYGEPVAQATLIEHTFGNSFGSPATVHYTPPSLNFSNVQLELEFGSHGNQYDRLGHIYLNNVEVWRLSTPEPGGKTVTAEMAKDVSHYLALFADSGTLSFQLDNVLDSSYTGPLECTLKIKYFGTGGGGAGGGAGMTDAQWFYDTPPNRVRALQEGSLTSSPPDQALRIPQLSKNTVRVGMMVYASGNSKEEFYYTNPETGSGPTRLIQVYVNNQLSGLVDPFQPLYTGGIQPRLWSPIVGVNAYDLPSYYLDLTPWLPRFWQQETGAEIKISNGYSGEGVGSDWLLNTALLEWQDETKEGSGGSDPQAQDGSSPATQASGDPQGSHVAYLGLRNAIKLSSRLQFSDGSSQQVTWQQESSCRNAQLLGGQNGTGEQFYAGYQHGTSMYSAGPHTYSRTHEFPLGLYMNGEATAIDQSYLVSAGDISLSNNARALWGGSSGDGTTGSCSWSGPAGGGSRSIYSKESQEAREGSGIGGGAGGSWTTFFNQLDSLAGKSDAGGLADQLESLRGKYARGSTGMGQ